MEFKKILVPVDGSETAEKAFKVGLDMAIKHNAELFLLYVADKIGRASCRERV